MIYVNKYLGPEGWEIRLVFSLAYKHMEHPLTIAQARDLASRLINNAADLALVTTDREAISS